jgi:hypothetical protein
MTGGESTAPEAPRSGGLYGTVLVLAVLIALTKSGKAEASILLGGVVVTSFVFWVVHVYADTLTARAANPARGWRELVRHHGHHELPILEASIGPGVPLLLGTLGLLSRQTASWAAIVVGLISLFGWGVAVARALGYHGGLVIGLGLLNVGLGLLMVGLKVLVH